MPYNFQFEKKKNFLGTERKNFFQEDGARNVVECVEKSHLPNTFRNSAKYNNTYSNEQNEINLMILSKEMMLRIVPDFCPNRILYNEN